MPIKELDLNQDTKWIPGDLFAVQLHNLEITEGGLGKTTSTSLMYDGKVLEVENGKISKAVLQKQIEDGKFEQHTMPLKKVSNLISDKEGGGTVNLETYSPIYIDENPPQRYLFTVIAGARVENTEEGEVKIEAPEENKDA